MADESSARWVLVGAALFALVLGLGGLAVGLRGGEVEAVHGVRRDADQRTFCELATRTGAAQIVARVDDPATTPSLRSTMRSFADAVAGSAPEAAAPAAAEVARGARHLRPGDPPPRALVAAAASVDRFVERSC